MFLNITGFLPGDGEDSSLKYDLDVSPEFEEAILSILGWNSLEEESDGEFKLSANQVEQISLAIKEQLPIGLELYIGVRA
jgi:hypothetical protein